MKKAKAIVRLLAPLCAAAPALALAQDNVAVFGVLDMYVDHATAGANSATRVQSGGVLGSRLGFRGSEKLGGDTRVVYTLESGMNVDDGTSGQGGVLFGRQAWVGLSTPAGEVTVGRHYAPYFFTLVTYALGGGLGWGNASNYFTDTSVLRVNNSVSYVSPSYAGLKLRALFGLGENTTQPGTNIGNTQSASLQYDRGPFSANVAYEARRTTALNIDRFYGVGASWQFSWAKASLLAQARRDDIGATENNALELSMLVPVGPGSLLLDVGKFRNRIVADADATAFSVRYDYSLSKRSTLYVGAAKIRNDARARIGINGNTGLALAVTAGADPRSMVMGMRHTF